MKKLFKLVIFILANYLITTSVIAQAPQKMSYQAVIRNSSNALVTNTQVGMRISILQGSATGIEVYKEIYNPNPSTNANGLVSIEIGAGIALTGTFATIDWSGGSYFIKTEIDPVGGNNYTITGTSQLLSMPYALYAKSAETFTGTITETDPNFGASLASGITGTDTTNWNNKQEQLTAGTGISIVGNTICATGSSSHYVGELYGGGVVFWVDHTGNHGLICSMIDNSTGIIWTTAAYQSSTVPGGALSDWDGQANTTAIVNQAGAGTTYAAGLCDAYTNSDYGTGVYSDWYLPAREELNHLWNNIYQVQKALDSDGNPATTEVAKIYYWSSSEYTNNTAWYFVFDFGYTYDYSKSSKSSVRAVRAF
jgi:hypothetical protein